MTNEHGFRVRFWKIRRHSGVPRLRFCQGATGPEVRGSGKPMLVTVTNELTDFGRQNEHFFIKEFPYLDTGIRAAENAYSVLWNSLIIERLG